MADDSPFGSPDFAPVVSAETLLQVCDKYYQLVMRQYGEIAPRLAYEIDLRLNPSQQSLSTMQDLAVSHWLRRQDDAPPAASPATPAITLQRHWDLYLSSPTGLLHHGWYHRLIFYLRQCYKLNPYVEGWVDQPPEHASRPALRATQQLRLIQSDALLHILPTTTLTEDVLAEVYWKTGLMQGLHRPVACLLVAPLVQQEDEASSPLTPWHLPAYFPLATFDAPEERLRVGAVDIHTWCHRP
jgi:hypothetical protein